MAGWLDGWQEASCVLPASVPAAMRACLTCVACPACPACPACAACPACPASQPCPVCLAYRSNRRGRCWRRPSPCSPCSVLTPFPRGAVPRRTRCTTPAPSSLKPWLQPLLTSSPRPCFASQSIIIMMPVAVGTTATSCCCCCCYYITWKHPLFMHASCVGGMVRGSEASLKCSRGNLHRA